MEDEMIEHPSIGRVDIPEGWERLMVGAAEPGDQILVGGTVNPKFMPWHPHDGVECLSQGSGTTRVEGKLTPYHCILIRETDTKYRYGYLMRPSPDDLSVSTLAEALDKAMQMSRNDRDHPVAVWDKHDKTLRLFAAAEEFVTV